VGCERLEAARETAGRSLREVQKRFESAFDNAPIGMALIAMDGRWLQVDDALCRITGRTGDELKSTTFAAITHPDDAGIDARGLAQLLTGEVRSNQVEARLRHAWGHDVRVLVTRSLGRDETCQHELLLRLPDETSGRPLPPSVFLYAAERSGLMQAIDTWVVRKAIGLIAEHTRADLLRELGVDLAQGYHIGVPLPVSEALRTTKAVGEPSRTPPTRCEPTVRASREART
jgi:PAS domain S-box-containing protein